MLLQATQLRLLTTAPECEGSCWCGDFGTDGECPARRRSDFLLPSDSDFLQALAEIGGLDLATTRARAVAVPRLPRCIPQVDGTAVCRHIAGPYVAVTFGLLVRRAGARPRSERTLNERLHLPPGTQVVLMLIATDAILDDLWARRGIWLHAMAKWQPSLVVAPDFSAWDGDPTLYTRYNIVRSLRFYGAIQDAGFRAIPHVFWATAKDICDWADWLNSNHVPVVSIDLQCRGRGRWWSDFLTDLASLRARLRNPPSLLLNGIDVGKDLARLLGVWPEVSITRNYAVEASKHRTPTLTPHGAVRLTASDRDPRDLLMSRIHFVEEWFAKHAA